ncbi:MAG TPA: hypothetical protein DD456_01295 [Stenotrophomonas sp.]|nr:hypothetical protein [Stenotrophomonas sp.]
MSLSSSTLIHFANSKDALKGILENNFKIFNCKETIVLDGKPVSLHIPMVSFCDIPLSKIKEHIIKYGSYGIGLRKEWAIANELNPVLYVSKKSALAKSYKVAFNHFVSDVSGELSKSSEEIQCIADIVRYIKNYEGDLTRKGTTIKSYRYSDEREWRYVPCFKDYPDMVVSANWYMQKDNKASCDSLLESLRLHFEPNDIKYIIIRDDSEISEFIDHLRKAKGKKYTHEDVERLTTRILTTEQIQADV